MTVSQWNSQKSRKSASAALSGLVVIVAMFCSAGEPALAKKKDAEQPEFIKDTTNLGKDKSGVVSDQAGDSGVPPANKLRLEGEDALRTGDLERAITVLQKAVELSPSNMDGRILYAESLEKKLDGQTSKDPKLYNFLVKQWLYVARRSDYPDQRVQGYEHLKILTHKVPKKFETEKSFLHRALIAEDKSAEPSKTK